MIGRKYLNRIVSMLVMMSFLIGNTGLVLAQETPSVSAPAQAVAAAPTSPVDETKVPHYFGPYANWANSPQVLANAIVDIGLGTPTPVSFGNPLVEQAYATDNDPTVFVVVPTAVLPNGTLQSFQTWNQASAGGSNTPSAGNTFHAYVLRPTVNANEYTVVFDSGLLTVPALTVAGVSEVATFPVTPTPVLAGDVIGFYGQGIPINIGAGTDILSFPAPAAPTQGSLVSLGVDVNFPIFPQARTYSFSASVTPTVTDPGTGAQAVATVDPKTGSITAITVTSPGAGYLVPPTVSISSPGVTPTTLANAAAQISLGVVNSIAVNETGFGFTTPNVTLTGGNPTIPATAQASGGVDNVTVFNGGLGYDLNAYVEFTLPELPTGVQAAGSLVIDGSGTITGVTVDNPGSGYLTAPGVSVIEPTSGLPTTAVVAGDIVTTIGIGQIDLTGPAVGGQGYDSAPTVTITDVGGVDRFASATASVAVKGAVTAINLVAPGFGGAGYLTPGLRKFVDTLPGLGPTGANNLGQYIPVAVADTVTYPGTDYYEIAVVQYRMQFHRDLPATLLRGYVQLSTSVVPGNQIPLSNANFDPALPGTPIFLPDGSPALGVDNPHYLGPTIVATKDKPVRILFRNLLPIGSDGDLFLPVDTSMMGSGAGPNMMMLDPVTHVPMDMHPDLGLVTDMVRNPMCGDYPKDMGCFAENRATLHLHGGITPWISDGTPHQWTTPDGQSTDYPRGVSVSNVPDMPDPGPGAITFFYTNQQSARLMFYHDHAWGITRLNVYAGEAAGYLVTDAMEAALIAPGGALAGLGVGTPLVVQDKTFVSDNIAQQDPTWNAARWGGTGSLWAPHVYMPAQNPGDPSGMSSFGRWMYGPWFWPPAKDAKYPPISNPYYNMDPLAVPPFSQPLTDNGLHDGQGNLKPCNLDDPTTWQYQSDPFCEPALIPSTPNVSVGMEAFNDTPIVNGTAYPTTTVDPKAYRFRILNAANDRFWNLSWYVADPRTGALSEVALNPVELAAAQTDPVVFPTPDTTWSPAGPNWIQIGTEGGFLPAPVVVPAHPTTWIMDPTRFDVGNVDLHSLLLAPAERADVIVDFSQFRGKTLILYNDAPAAFPARVPGYDYYTGGPDLSPAGAPTTLPGYGPNTRTIMRVTVSSAAPEVPFDRPNTTADRMGALVTAWGHKTDGSGVFESSMDPIIVGQAAYNSAYGTAFAAGGWCNSPTNPTAKCDGFARIAEGSQPTDLFKFDTLGPAQDGNGAQLQIPFQPKGLHDEMNSANFDEWGRMTANLGLEAPGATPLLQNIILYPYVNPATEILDSSGLPSALDVTPIASADDGTQIWKITHNGVDTHPIHFHLYDVQLINRVTWDNIIIPPEPTELGWKDTVRVSPLEDTIVAVRPIVPVIPFGIPESSRPLNPMMPIGARGSVNDATGTEAGFNNTDPLGQAWPNGPIINEVVNFGWEYVFHCHILSHEEMDMMRPVSVYVPSDLPDAPVLSYTQGSVILSWTDGTPVDYTNPASWVSAKNEIGYRIERADVTNGVVGPYAQIATTLANVTTYTDNPPDPFMTYSYRVIAWNVGGDSPSNELLVSGLPVASTTVLTSSLNPSNVGDNVTFTATVSPVAATGNVTFNIDGVNVFTLPLAGGQATFSTAALAAGTHPVIATYSGDASYLPSSDSLSQVVSQGASSIVVTSSLNPSNYTNTVTFTAAVSPAAATGTVEFFDGAASLGSSPLSGGTASLPIATLSIGTHSITAAYSGDATYLPSTSAAIDQVVLDPTPAAPSNLVATAVSSTQINLTWTDNANNETGFTIQRATNSAFTSGLNTITLNAANQTAYNNTGRNPSTTYYYRVRAFNAFGFSAWSNIAFAFTAIGGSPAAPSNLVATALSPTQISLTWTDNAIDETGFTVQRATNADFTGATNITLNGVDIVTYLNPGRTPNTTYYYRVRAFNLTGPSAWSNTASATTPALALPAAPSNLVAVAFSPTQINLGWTDNATNETGFTLQRATNATFTAGGTNITLNAVDQIAYNNTGRQPNTTYYYRVRAFNADGVSAWSNTASATTPPSIPAVPAGLTVTASAANSLDINWTYTSNGVPGPITFQVQRSDTGAGGWTTVANGISATTFTNAGLPANVTRYYRVRAIAPTGTSAYSTPVSGITLP